MPVEKKMCSVFNYDRHRENRCCFTCPDYSRCINHCLNSPRRCGLAKDPKAKKGRSSAHGKEPITT